MLQRRMYVQTGLLSQLTWIFNFNLCEIVRVCNDILLRVKFYTVFSILQLQVHMYIHAISNNKANIKIQLMEMVKYNKPGSPDFSWHMVPKPHKCNKWTQNVTNGHKIYQMSVKYVNIFQSKALQYLPPLGFLVWK
jgi:hypothetical protein